jgi:hypothetical protein
MLANKKTSTKACKQRDVVKPVVKPVKRPTSSNTVTLANKRDLY